MARRRLAPASLAVADAPPPHPGAPIARITGDAAASAALDELAEAFSAARDEGRMVLELPLGAVAPDHLVRDRLPREDEEMAALKVSIRAHGQRTPIEVVPLAGPLPWGLVSGWRRLVALEALHAETGDPRFATVRALAIRPESAEASYVAMVEENEVRVGLSQYERARVAALATQRGIFESEQAALRTLFASASRPKRSRIRAFLGIYHALDGTLRFAAAMPERLGLKLAERIQAGEGPAIRRALERARPDTPEAELALLQSLVAPRPARPGPERVEIRPGVALETRRGRETLTLILRGKGVTPGLEAEIRDQLSRLPVR